MNKTRYNIGYTAGMFDILHIGHIETLRRAKSMCDHLIVAVGTDDFLKIRKNRLPVMPFEHRFEIIRSIKYVDTAVSVSNLNKMAEYYKYKFDVMFAGNDHENEPIYIKAQSELSKLGVKVVYLEHLHKISSTAIRTSLSSFNTVSPLD